MAADQVPTNNLVVPLLEDFPVTSGDHSALGIAQSKILFQ